MPDRYYLSTKVGKYSKLGTYSEPNCLAYNKGFEWGCLAALAEELPQYENEIKNIQGRLWDPLPVIRSHVYHLEFRGSFSLKAVLPVLVPDMTYEGMAVSDGAEAGLAWEKMLCAETGGEERKKLRSDLLAYCRQDTLAMVRLLEILRASL